ncbi:uncharacterized protein BX664DRAFT_340929 [Halteromyces radiatus]|uniref:uncharacterized protein n=1 Tax=Halteromyces radiatus TaxID=101107 RepID=UPI0022210986|nr:uncharacterized protein BX664DRAFT_340929 [Halteromyces radiatus]KAI8081652.1 hypothetical protein BX664DRAFT_340929 [Halteromyces radiatus]
MLLKSSLLLCVNVALAAAMYSSRDAVVELTTDNFKQQVLDNDKLVAVEFYAPWCGHCQKLAPEWKKAANNLKGLVDVAAIDCDQDANKPICGQYGIQGFPTIKIFRPSVNKKGVRTKSPSDYQGPREAKPIVDHLLSLQPSQVRLIKGDPNKVKSKASISLDDFLATDNTTLTKVILFTDKPTTTPLYKALSVDFGNGRLLMGEVKKNEKLVLDQFGIDTFPTLLVIPPGQDALVYSGKLKYQPLYDYLSTYTSESVNQKDRTKSSKKSTTSPLTAAEPIVKPKVVELGTNEALKEHCLASGNIICAITIVSPEEKDEGITVLNDINEQNTNTLFRFGWMTSDKASDIIQQLDLVQDYPGLFILHASKQLYRPYIGAWENKSITRWLNQISSGRVQAWPYSGDLKVTDTTEQQQVEQEDQQKEEEGQSMEQENQQAEDQSEDQQRVRDEL